LRHLIEDALSITSFYCVLCSDCSFTQMPIDGKLHKVPCVQFAFSDDIVLSESIERAVNVIADSVCSVLLDTIIKGIVSCTN
jgi:hypothetical protein